LWTTLPTILVLCVYSDTRTLLNMLKRITHNNCMNRLGTPERARIIAALVAGNSLRATRLSLSLSYYLSVFRSYIHRAP
jgi:hypothetical protein